MIKSHILIHAGYFAIIYFCCRIFSSNIFHIFIFPYYCNCKL